MAETKRYEVRANHGDSVSNTALRFASLDEANDTYERWAESGCYGRCVELVDHRRPKNWLLRSTASPSPAAPTVSAVNLRLEYVIDPKAAANLFAAMLKSCRAATERKRKEREASAKRDPAEHVLGDNTL